MSVSSALMWILFLGLFPLAFIWLRRAWRILCLHDLSEVALKRGVPPKNAAKFIPYTATINLVAGVIMTAMIVSVIGGVIAYEKWTAIAGTTIWMKLIADFIISQHAHPIWTKSRK